MRASLSFPGFACAMKSSTPASAAIAAAVNGLSPVIMTVLIPMRRNSAKRSLMPPFTTSFRCTTPSTCAPSATTRGVPPWRAMASTLLRTVAGRLPAEPFHMQANCLCRALANLPHLAVFREVDAAHLSLSAEWDEVSMGRGQFAPAQAQTALWPTRRWNALPGFRRPAMPTAPRQPVARQRFRAR